MLRQGKEKNKCDIAKLAEKVTAEIEECSRK